MTQKTINSKIMPYSEAIFNSKSNTGKNRFNSGFGRIGNNDVAYKILEFRYHGLEVHNALNKYTKDRFHWGWC